MTPEILTAWVGVGAAAAVGAVGWIFAGIANARAKSANKLAADANQHASDAVEEARKANTVAEAANKLSEESNRVVLLEAAKSEEHWFTEWSITWDREAGRITLKNTGRDPAFDPNVTINGKHLNEVVRDLQTVPRGEVIRLDFPELVEQRDLHNAQANAKWREEKSPGIIGIPFYWRDQLDILVTWRTGLGQPREQRFPLVIG